jgi:hypothetical protein
MGWFTHETHKHEFFLPSNARNVQYIRRLSMARIAAKRWMVHGRATRSLVLGGDPMGYLQAGCFLRDGKPEESRSVLRSGLAKRVGACKLLARTAPTAVWAGRT